MGIPTTAKPDQHHALATEALGFDAGLLASIEQFSALGIDLLGLQVQPLENEGFIEGRAD